MELPIALRPVFRFGIHVVLGSLAFLIVYTVSVGVGWWVDFTERNGAPHETVLWGRRTETAILWLDLFALGLFLLKETLKLVRHLLLRDWEDGDG